MRARRPRDRRRVFERPDALVVEIDPAGERLNTCPERLRLDTRPRHFGYQSLKNLIVKRIPLGLATFKVGGTGRCIAVDPCLRLKRRDERRWIEQQLHQGIEQPTEKPHDRAAFVNGVVAQGEFRVSASRQRVRRRSGTLPQLIEQRRIDGTRVEDCLQPTSREVLDLLRSIY